MRKITMDNEEWEHDIRFFNKFENATNFFLKKIEEREDYWYIVNRDTNYADIDSTIMRLSEVITED
jgi:hypothetical protein